MEDKSFARLKFNAVDVPKRGLQLKFEYAYISSQNNNYTNQDEAEEVLSEKLGYNWATYI